MSYDTQPKSRLPIKKSHRTIIRKTYTQEILSLEPIMLQSVPLLQAVGTPLNAEDAVVYLKS